MTVTSFLLANFYLACWMLVYYLAFSRKTTFQLNRAMLLIGIAIAFLLPFIVLPSISLFSTGNVVHSVITATGGTAMIIPGQSAATHSSGIPFWEMILWIYWTGVALAGIVFLWKLIKIGRLVRKFPLIKQHGYIQVQTPDHWEVFSFVHYLFAPENTLLSIIEHEKVHIRQRHSVDNFFTEIIKIFCWFNPAVYYCQKALKMEHEYLADAATIKIVDVKEYAEKLVSRSFKISNLSLVHPFLNRSNLQKRLVMLQKRNRSNRGAWTYLFMLPILGGILLLVSSFSLKNKVHDAIATIKPAELDKVFVAPSSIGADTTIEGLIHSSSGEPIPGVTILVKGTTRGTSTNNKGRFSLSNVASGTILKISSIGYNTITIQIPQTKKALNIVLYPQPKSLNQVSVNAYTNKPVSSASKRSKGNTKPVAAVDNRVFLFVEQMPHFPGGQSALMTYLSTHVKYPKIAKENGIQGTVVAQFVVQKDGTIADVKTIGPKKGGGLEEEAIRVVKGMPKWKPGRQNGKAVSVQFSLPIRFQLHHPDRNKPITVIGKPAPPPPPSPSDQPQSAGKNNVYTFVKQMPSFPGGESAMMKFLSDHVQYPKEAREDGTQGTVLVRFVVQENGKLTQIKTVGKKLGGGLEKEAMRLVKQMPKWNPGKQEGKAVNVQYTLPVRFKLK